MINSGVVQRLVKLMFQTDKMCFQFFFLPNQQYKNSLRDGQNSMRRHISWFSQKLVNFVDPSAEFSPISWNTSFSLFKVLLFKIHASSCYATIMHFCVLIISSRLQRDLAKCVISHFVVQQLVLDFDQLVIILKYYSPVYKELQNKHCSCSESST